MGPNSEWVCIYYSSVVNIRKCVNDGEIQMKSKYLRGLTY